MPLRGQGLHGPSQGGSVIQGRWIEKVAAAKDDSLVDVVTSSIRGDGGEP
jgi:hypothetical protein